MVRKFVIGKIEPKMGRSESSPDSLNPQEIGRFP
jgi:hypothetical protein